MGEAGGSEEHLETLCAELDQPPPSVTRPAVTPIVASAPFVVDSLETLDDLYEGRVEGFVYSRGANPNQVVLEGLVARLEGAEAGLACASACRAGSSSRSCSAWSGCSRASASQSPSPA
jgi:O-acetylhomoserine/O-acetylserine sulfhydrylase-like pyridoxal-dependent enzyme